jgi:hypothetical protein
MSTAAVVVAYSQDNSNYSPKESSSEPYGGWFHGNPDTEKKLAKLNDTTVKLATSSPLLRNFPVIGKFLPMVSKVWATDAGFMVAAKETDDNQFSSAAWEIGGAANNMAAAVLNGVGTSSAAVEHGLTTIINDHTGKTLMRHVYDHSGYSKALKGYWDGTPFFTSSQVRAFEDVVFSSEYRNLSKDLVRSIADNAPNPANLTEKIQKMLSQSVGSSAWSRMPEFPTQQITESVNRGISSAPGRVGDVQKMSKMGAVLKPLSTKYIPGVSVLMDGRGAYGSWQKLYAADEAASKASLVGAAITSSISVIGSVINAVALNPRTASKMPKNALPLAFGMMVAGAAGSYIIERNVQSKATQSRKNEERS